MSVNGQNWRKTPKVGKKSQRIGPRGSFVIVRNGSELAPFRLKKSTKKDQKTHFFLAFYTISSLSLAKKLVPLPPHPFTKNFPKIPTLPPPKQIYSSLLQKKSQNWQHTRQKYQKNINTLFNALIYDRTVTFRYIK
jgi:hypothetical protein